MSYLKEVAKLLFELCLNWRVLIHLFIVGIFFYFVSLFFSPEEYEYTSTLRPIDKSSKIEKYNSLTGLLSDIQLKDFSFANPELYNTIIFSEAFLYDVLSDSIMGTRIYDYLCDDLKPTFKTRIKSFPSFILSHVSKTEENVKDFTIPPYATLLLKYRINIDIDHLKSCMHISTTLQNQEATIELNNLIINKLHDYLKSIYRQNRELLFYNNENEMSNYKVKLYETLDRIAKLKETNNLLAHKSHKDALEISRLESEVGIYRNLINEVNGKTINTLNSVSNPNYFQLIGDDMQKINHYNKLLFPLVIYVFICFFFDVNKLKRFLERKPCLKFVVYFILFYIMIW